MNIVLIGPYGAGKGTQATKLAGKFDLHHISTGDLFREHLRRKTELGLLIQNYLDQGELVPDSVADATMEEYLRVCSPQKGILFDGFPRTKHQAKFLETLFIELGRSLHAVVYLKAPDEVVTERLSQRLVCATCHLPFHQSLNPFSRCPYGQCQGEQIQPIPEDAPEKVQVRLKTFHEETEPLVDYYQELEKLVVVDADKPMDQVHHSIVHALQNRLARR